MKLRLSELELARRDPAEYLRLQGPDIDRSRKMTHTRVLQGAILELHKTGELGPAFAYLHQMYYRHFHKDIDYEKLADRLQDYIARYQETGMTNSRIRDRVVLGVNRDLLITGQVPSIELTPDGGYAAVFFAGNPPDSWFDDLRYPLVQLHYSKSLGVSLDEVTIGMFGFKSGSYEFAQSNESEIRAALIEVSSVARRIERILG
jgi:hypothetical protein